MFFEQYTAILCFFLDFFCVFFMSPSTSVVSENAAKLLCCEAPKEF